MASKLLKSTLGSLTDQKKSLKRKLKKAGLSKLIKYAWRTGRKKAIDSIKKKVYEKSELKKVVDVAREFKDITVNAYFSATYDIDYDKVSSMRKSANTDKEKLNKEYESKTASLESLKLKLFDLYNRLNELKEKRQALLPDDFDLSQKLDDLDDRIDEYSLKLSELNKSIESSKLIKTSEISKSDYEDLLGQKQDLVKSIIDLKSEKNDLIISRSSNVDELKEIDSEINEVQLEIDTIKLEISRLESESELISIKKSDSINSFYLSMIEEQSKEIKSLAAEALKSSKDKSKSNLELKEEINKVLDNVRNIPIVTTEQIYNSADKLSDSQAKMTDNLSDQISEENSENNAVINEKLDKIQESTKKKPKPANKLLSFVKRILGAAWTGVSALFRIIPFGQIIGPIVGIIGGVLLFKWFMKTELGKKIAELIGPYFKKTVNFIKGLFKTIWAGFIKPQLAKLFTNGDEKKLDSILDSVFQLPNKLASFLGDFINSILEDKIYTAIDKLFQWLTTTTASLPWGTGTAISSIGLVQKIAKIGSKINKGVQTTRRLWKAASALGNIRESIPNVSFGLIGNAIADTRNALVKLPGRIWDGLGDLGTKIIETIVPDSLQKRFGLGKYKDYIAGQGKSRPTEDIPVLKSHAPGDKKAMEKNADAIQSYVKTYDFEKWAPYDPAQMTSKHGLYTKYGDYLMKSPEKIPFSYSHDMIDSLMAYMIRELFTHFDGDDDEKIITVYKNTEKWHELKANENQKKKDEEQKKKLEEETRKTDEDFKKIQAELEGTSVNKSAPISSPNKVGNVSPNNQIQTNTTGVVVNSSSSQILNVTSGSVNSVSSYTSYVLPNSNINNSDESLESNNFTSSETESSNNESDKSESKVVIAPVERIKETKIIDKNQISSEYLN